MIVKLAFPILLLLGVISGCSNEDSLNAENETPITQSSVSNNDQENFYSSESTQEMAEVDYGMGHYTEENIESAQDYYEEEQNFDESVYGSENPPFELRIYSEIDQGLEASRYYSSKYGEGMYDGVAAQYNTHVSIISDYDGKLTIKSLIVNKGQSCPLIGELAGFIMYGEKASKEIHSCDVDQIRHMLVQTNIGDFEFGF